MAFKRGFGDIQNLPGQDAQPSTDPDREAIGQNLSRVFDGAFNGIEERAAQATPLPETWKRRYALSWFLADRMKLGLDDVRTNFDNYRKLYFGEDATDETAYAKALLVRGQEDRIGEAKIKAPETPGVLDLAVAEGIADPNRAMDDIFVAAGAYDPQLGEPGFMAEGQRSVVRSAAAGAYGGAAGLANLAGLSETARKIAAYNAEVQERLAARPDWQETLKQSSHSWKQALTKEWWGITFSENLGFAAQFMAGAGPATAASKLLLSAKLAPAIGRGAFIASEAVGTGAMLGAGEGLVESGSALSDINAQAAEFRRIAEHLESLPPEQFLAIYNKGMLKGAARYREMASRGTDPEIAGKAAAKVFWDNMKVNAILNAIGLGTGRVAGARLFKNAKGKAASVVMAAAGDSWLEIEQELKQNGIQDRAAMEAFTGNMVELNLIKPEILDAFFGDDPQKFDTALATLIFSSKSSMVGLMQGLAEAKTLAEFEAKVREAEGLVAKAASQEQASPEVKALMEELKQAKTPEEKAAVFAKTTREQFSEMNRRLAEEEDLASLEDELAVEELEQQRDVELAEVTAEPAPAKDAAEIQAEPIAEAPTEPIAPLPPPRPGPGVTVAEIDAHVQALGLLVGEVRAVETAEQLPPEVLADAERQSYSLDQIEGLVAPDGTVYLVAANLPSLARAELVALHEVISHLGVEKVLGGRFGQVMDQVFAGRPDEEILAIAAKYGLKLGTEAGRRKAAAEILAKAAENPEIDADLWQRIVAAVRQLLRDLGFVSEFSDADIRALLARAREAVAVEKDGETRFSIAEARLAETVVRGPDGNPLLVYHGTDAAFNDFKDGLIYFTPDPRYGYIRKSKRVIEAFINITKPYFPENQSEVEQLRSNPERVDELKSQGYDGVIWAKRSDMTKGPSGWGNDYPQMVVFSSSQVVPAEQGVSVAGEAKAETRYSLKDQDAAYLAAVEAGDMETAQRMVDEAAKRAGYTQVAWHQTSTEAATAIYREGFRLDKGRARLSDEQVPDAFFFKADPGDIGVGSAEKENVAQLQVFLRYQNPAVFTDRRDLESWLQEDKEYAAVKKELAAYDQEQSRAFDEMWETIRKAESRDARQAEKLELKLDEKLDAWQTKDREYAAKARVLITARLRNAGHDAVILAKDKGSFGRTAQTTMVFDPSQIKSADPVVRDDAGNVIPLSQRFQAESPDIRYSLSDSRRNPERDAAVVFAERLFRGEEVSREDVAAALKKAGADEAGAKVVLERARALSEQFEQEKEPAKTDPEIRAALRSLEIRNHYEQLIDQVYSQGSARGKYTEAARARLAEARKAEDERNLAARTGLDLEELKASEKFDLSEQLRQAILPKQEEAAKPEKKTNEAAGTGEAEAELEETEEEAEVEPEETPFDEPTPRELAFDPAKVEEVMARVKELVRKKMVAEKVFTDRTQFPERNPVFRAEYRATMAAGLEAATKELAYGRMREFIMANLAQLRGRVSVKAIDAGIVRIARKIQREGQRQGKREILRQIEKLLKSKKIFVRDTAAKDALRKPISSAALRWLRLVRGVYRAKLESVQADIQELQDWLNDTAGLADADQEKAQAFRKKIEAKYTALQDPGFREMDLDAIALTLHQALFQYGALREKSLEEVGQAYEWIKGDIQGGIDQQEKRRAERKAQLDGLKKGLAGAVLPKNPKAKPPESDLAASVEQYATAVMGFQERLKDVIRFGSAEARKDAEEAMRFLDRRLSEAATQEDTIRREAWEELKAAVGMIYRVKPGQVDRVIADLQRPKEEYAQFSTRGVPQYLSRASLIQMLATWEQKEYQEQMRENVRGEAYMAKVRAALSKEDLALYSWLRATYERNRKALSDVSKRVSGVPIVSPDPLYMPVKLEEKLGDLPTTVKAAVVIPKSLSERIKNNRDIDETASVLTVWEDRLRQNAHFVSHAELSLDLRGIFGAPELQESIRDVHGKRYLSRFLGHVVDIINGGAMTSDLSLPEKIRSYATFTALGGNVKSMLSNLAGLPAFAHEIGLVDTTRHFATALSPEGIAAIRDILKTQAARNRYYFGNSESVRLALSQKDDNAIKKFARVLMRTNTIGDGFALIVGQGIYREIVARELSRGLSESVANETASQELFNIIERTQASGQIKDLSEWQRRGGWAARILSQFVGPVTRLASYEVQAFREVAAGTPGAKRKLANTILINHFLIPAVYQGVRMAWDAFLGDDKDDDEILAEFIVAALSGPAAGLIVFGSMAESTLRKLITGKSYGDGLAATSNVTGLAGDVFQLLSHLTWEFNTEEALNDAADVMGRAFRPFKDARKFYENRIKD